MGEDTGFDISEIEDDLVNVGDLMMMGFSAGKAFVPLKVIAATRTVFIYDTIGEGMLSGPLAASTTTNGITNLSFTAPNLLGSKNLPGSPPDVFNIQSFPGILEQLHVGIDPAPLRVLLQSPFRINAKAVPIVGWYGGYQQAAFIDGFMSPLRRPTSFGEIWVAPGCSIAMGFAHQEPAAVYPLLNFHMNVLKVGVVADPELVERMINEPGLAKFESCGDLQDFSYNVPTFWGCSGVTLDATRAEIAAGIQQTQSVNASSRPLT
jgi:hypothetical protein